MVWATLGFVFGAWCLQQQSTLAGLQASWILGCGAGLLILFYFKLKFKRIKLQKISLFLAAFLCGFLWANLQASKRLATELPVDWQQQSINMVGVIASLPEVNERGERFQFDVEKILTQDSTHSLKVPRHISLNFYVKNQSDSQETTSAIASQQQATEKPNIHFHAGERWQFSVRLKRPHSTYNPHGYDFEAWALEQNIRATGTVSTKSGYKKLNHFVTKPRYLIESAREKVGNYISQTLANKPFVGVIRALVVGDDSQISVTDWNIYLRTGVNHLMSISGLHITMLAGLAYGIAAFAWRRVPSLVLRMPTRKAATIAGLIAAVLYALLAGMSVPTQRTLLMLITFALALLLGRNVGVLRALCLALIVVVLFDPWATISAGFWLSFGAVAVITYASVGRLQAAHWLKSAINTQWAVTIGLLPMLIVMFGQTSIVSPLANAFAIPVISLIVVPLAIAGSVLHIDFLLHAAHWVLQICMHGLESLSNLPTWQQAAPPVWALLLALFGTLCLLLPRGFPQRWLGILLMLPLFFVPTSHPKIGEMQVAVLDVGQGLSVVIKTANHTFLYDAGPQFSTQSDAGSRIVVPYLRGEGIKKIDGFVVSHNDSDHSGGARSVLTQMPVTWLASSFDSPPEWPQNAKKLRCFAGQHWVWDKVRFAVLHPSIASYDDTKIKDNNRSCVVKVTSQFGSVLLTGDIEQAAETAMMEYALQANIHAPSGGMLETDFSLKSDVLIVPHHGSKTSSSSEFVQAVGARHSIFTVGYLNRFNHPKPLIEKRYEESGAFEYRSDYAGAISIDFKASNAIQLQSWRKLVPRYWQDQFQE
jgi:competence protein ComEC